MSISAINSFASPSPRSTAQAQADETTQELANQGDPVAIAKLKQEQEQLDPSLFTGPSEPGKGEQIDQYI